METLKFGLVLLLELVPLFLLISAAVYFVVETLTPERIRALLARRSSWLGVPLASALGAVTPFCSCSTVPLVNGMRAAGISVAPMVAFLIASPLIHPVAVGLLWTAVGPQYALYYTVAALGIAVGGGVLVALWNHVTDPVSAAPVAGSRTEAVTGASASGTAGAAAPVMTGGDTAETSWSERLRRAFRKSWIDFRKLALPLVLAVAVGALIHGYAPEDFLTRVAGPGAVWAVPLAAVSGIPVYASILVLLPLGTSLLAKGVGIGAVTAFLMGAAGFSVPEAILLSRVLPKALLVRVLVVFSTGVMGIGYLFQWLVG